MFIIIEHGDGKNLLVNPDCTATAFTDYVRRNSGLGPKESIDICDDTAQLFEIYKKDPNENLFDYFVPRSTYLLLKIELNPDGSVQKVTPVLSEWEKKYEFLERKLKKHERRTKQATTANPNNGKILNDSRLGIFKKRELSTSRTDNRRESNFLKEETVSPKKSFGGRSKKK